MRLSVETNAVAGDTNTVRGDEHLCCRLQAPQGLNWYVSKQAQDRVAVRQANALARSGQELELIEKRLLLVAMSRISKQDTELLTHRISVTDLAPFFGGDPWRAASKAATGLLKRVVYIEGENGGFTAFQWTTLARYVSASHSETGSSYLEIRLNQELAPFLLELKERFNVIPLLELLPMGSVNSQRLYEILWHDSFKGQKVFLTYGLEDLRFQLGLRVRKNVKGKDTWVEKYATWRDFQKVLKRAQADFETHGTLAFDYEGLAQGRTTTQVRFRISRRADPDTIPDIPAELEPRDHELARELEAAGYQQDALGAIAAHGFETVEMALKLARAAERQGARSNKPIYNPGGLIHHALTSGLAARRLTSESKPAQEKLNPREVAQSLVDAFTAARYAWADRFWEEGTEDFREGFPGIMQLELSNFQMQQLEKANWQGTLFESSRREMILKLYPDEIPDALFEVDQYAENEGFFASYEGVSVEAVISEAKQLL
jgi:plasmid replication initiation protein